MAIWDTYPTSYRKNETQKILSAVQSGECVAILGLSGAGKSNLMGFIAHRKDVFVHPTLSVDCNRLFEQTPDAFLRLIRQALGDADPTQNELAALDAAIRKTLSEDKNSLALLFDRFEALSDDLLQVVAGGLRSLRDTYKYQLTYVIASRKPFAPDNELAELFFANTFWLGPLSQSDSRWNVDRYAQRKGAKWEDKVAEKLIELSWGYPSLLRAVCEAFSSGADFDEMVDHAAIRRRVDEFWADKPSDNMLNESGLAGQPLLMSGRVPEGFDTSQLTAKEHLLLEYLRAHPDEVCGKDALIRAVWPEDEIYTHGIRDDSLAQLVRRLRVKIEPDPSQPSFIQTVPGRGYKFIDT